MPLQSCLKLIRSSAAGTDQTAFCAARTSLREHFRMGLDIAASLHFELEEVFTARADLLRCIEETTATEYWM